MNSVKTLVQREAAGASKGATQKTMHSETTLVQREVMGANWEATQRKIHLKRQLPAPAPLAQGPQLRDLNSGMKAPAVHYTIHHAPSPQLHHFPALPPSRAAKVGEATGMQQDTENDCKLVAL